MADIVTFAIVISALIILIGFLSNYLFQKTGFPDMLILLLLGLILGPVLGVFDPTSIRAFTPYLAALALSCMVFDGGMGLNIRQVLYNSPKALLLAILGFIFSITGVTIFMMLVFNMPILYSILFGAIFGGSSSVVVISLASKIKISEKGSTILILESAITDVFSIVIALAIIDILLTGEANVGAIGLSVAGKFIIGMMTGFVLGFTWLFALRKVSTIPYCYILTLGVVLLGYAGTEAIGGSGVLSVLLFGLILGNEREILKSLTRNIETSENCRIFLSVSRGLKRFESEVAFLIGTFFFVFLGMITTVSALTVLASGIVLSIIMLIVRYGAVWLTTRNNSLQRERKMLTVILTRGLATAVLATLPAQYGLGVELGYPELFIDITVVVVVVTAVMATVGSMLLSRKRVFTTYDEIAQD